MPLLYELTEFDTEKETNSRIIVSATTETEVRLGDLLFEYNEAKQFIADKQAEIDARTIRKEELYDILLAIKTNNSLTFDLEE